ncbi:MAG: PepSY domain-containing protein, partial [Acidobacteriota bacterium]
STANAQQKKIGMKRATAIAATKAPGLKLKAKELENEGGKWIYSFEFRNRDGSTREVNVDALTGEIVGVEHESKKQDAKEARDEKNEKKTKH